MCFYIFFFFFEYRLSINIFRDYTRNWHTARVKKGGLHRSIIGWTFIFIIGRREPADNVKKLLDAVIDEGKFYFESVLFDIVKKIVGRNVGISGIMEMGRMCVMVIRKKRLEFFITLYQDFLGFWSVVSCNIQWNGTAFRDKNNKVEQDNLCIVGVHKSLWKLITKIYIFFWYTYSWIFVKFWIFFFNSMFKIKVPDDFYVIIFAIFRQQYCLYYIKCN